MADGRLYEFLRRFADIRPNEARAALYLFLYFFLVAFSIYIIKPVKENFLIGITPAWWPYADLITAGLIGFVVAFNTKLLNRLPRRSYFSRTIIFFIINLFIFWIIFDASLRDSSNSAGYSGILGAGLVSIQDFWPVPVFAFSFWADIFIATSVTHFWIAVNDVFNPHQAKRLVGFLVTGGLAGGISGSLLTSRLVHELGPSNLLLACPVLLILTPTIISAVYGERSKIREATESSQTKTGPKTSYLESLRLIQSDRYLRFLMGILALAMLVGSLINYQFKIVIKDSIPDDVARTSFLGTFFLGILLLSPIFHLITTEQVLKKLGIRVGLLIAPSVLLMGSLAVFLFPASALLIWACFIRGSDKTFDNTIGQSARELLYIPIPANIKYEAKILIDMFVNKFAVGLGAVLFWTLYRVSSFENKTPFAQVGELGVFVIIFALACIGLTWIIYAEYLSTVKKELSRKWQDAHKVVAEHVDIDATRLIVDTVQSREKSSTLYAMNLFKLVQKEKLSPELIAFLSGKEDELKARSMDSLLDVGGEVFYQGIEEMITENDVEPMVGEIVSLDGYKSVMEKRFNDLISNKNVSEIERMEAARLIGLLEPTPGVLSYLERLLQDPSPDVLNYALSSAAIHRRREHLPIIIALLGNPMIMHVAQDTLAAYGPGIENILKKHLRDSAENLEVRNAIPDVLARLGNQKAADILIAELALGNEDMELEIIDALYKIRSNQPNVSFKKKKIFALVLSLVSKSYKIYLSEAANPPPAGTKTPGLDRKARLDIKVKRIFDLLTLVYPPEDIVKAQQNLMQGTHKSIDFSLELLDNILDQSIKAFLFPIIEDLPPDEKSRRIKKLAESLGQHLAATEREITTFVV